MKSVVVTGAGSGIGYAITNYLVAHDFKVYAAVRNPDDFSHFDHSNIEPVLMDVTRPDQINTVVEGIGKKDHDFYAVINNAGIGSLGFLHLFTEIEMKELFDINVFGPWRVSKAFLPLLMKTSGHVITIGSRGGMITKALFGAYSMTKFAMEAYTDAMRQELLPHGVKVSLIQPGGVSTSIGAKSKDGVIIRMGRAEPPFKEMADQVLMDLQQKAMTYNPSEPESEQNRNPSHPDDVAKVVLSILTHNPQIHRHLVCTQWEGEQVIDTLLDRLMMVNENPNLRYSTEELVSRLTGKLATSP